MLKKPFQLFANNFTNSGFLPNSNTFFTFFEFYLNLKIFSLTKSTILVIHQNFNF